MFQSRVPGCIPAAEMRNVLSFLPGISAHTIDEMIGKVMPDHSLNKKIVFGQGLSKTCFLKQPKMPNYVQNARKLFTYVYMQDQQYLVAAQTLQPSFSKNFVLLIAGKTLNKIQVRNILRRRMPVCP